MKPIEQILDIVGINEAGIECHPYKGLKGDKTGYFSYTFKTDSNTDFARATEADLRKLIEGGEFNDRGRIRMVPANALSTSGAGALRVIRYKGRLLPL